jgi:homocitrate synthase NifV
VAPAALPSISALVERASGRPIAANKSIVGAAVFTHESGIHVDGLIKDPRNYEGFDPAELGRAHRLVLGKHSGSQAVRAACALIGLHPSDAEVARMIERIRAYATETKSGPDATQLRDFYLEASESEAVS